MAEDIWVGLLFSTKSDYRLFFPIIILLPDDSDFRFAVGPAWQYYPIIHVSVLKLNFQIF